MVRNIGILIFQLRCDYIYKQCETYSPPLRMDGNLNINCKNEVEKQCNKYSIIDDSVLHTGLQDKEQIQFSHRNHNEEHYTTRMAPCICQDPKITCE